jgi:hypothetical protein
MKKIILTENQVKFVVDSMIEEQIGFEKQDDVNVILSTKDPKIAKRFTGRNLKSMVFAAGGQWDNKTNQPVQSPEFDKTVAEMKSMMDESSAQVFDTMKQSNPNFYYYVVSSYNNGALGGQVKNKKIVVDNQVTIKQEMIDPGKPGGEVDVPVVEEGYEIFSPPKIQQPMQFAYNEAIMTPEFITYINENLLAAIDEGIANMTANLEKKGRGVSNLYINKLQITSSSSTIPNGVSKRTFPGKVPTFKELSDARAKVVYEYLTKELAKRKAEINPSGVVINSDGTNAGQMLTLKNGDKMVQLDGTGTSGEAYVGQDKEQLIKNQRVEFVVEFAVKGTTPPQSTKVKVDPIPPQFAPVEKTDFMVRFTAKGRNIFKFRPNLNIRITLPRLSFGIFSKRGKGIPCPKFRR